MKVAERQNVIYWNILIRGKVTSMLHKVSSAGKCNVLLDCVGGPDKPDYCRLDFVRSGSSRVIFKILR